MSGKPVLEAFGNEAEAIFAGGPLPPEPVRNFVFVSASVLCHK